jgi:hypothetical protein
MGLGPRGVDLAIALCNGPLPLARSLVGFMEQESDLKLASPLTLIALLAGCAAEPELQDVRWAGGLDQGPGATPEQLVGVRAANPVAYEQGWDRVVPGDPDASFLCRKLERPGVGEGAAMPSEEWALGPEATELVWAWIEQGARP